MDLQNQKYKRRNGEVQNQIGGNNSMNLIMKMFLLYLQE